MAAGVKNLILIFLEHARTYETSFMKDLHTAELANLLIFGSVGLILIIIGSISLVRTLIFTAFSRSSRGVVTGFIQNIHGKMVTYAPVVRFSDGDRIIKFTDQIFTNPPRCRIGQRVEVLYPRRNLQDAQITTNFQMYLVPLILLLIEFSFSGGLILMMFLVREFE